MNRRPSKSRSEFDAFSEETLRPFSASSPDAHFFDVQKKRSPHRILLTILLILIALVFICNAVINHFFFINTIEIPITGLSQEFDGFRILQISDLKGKRFGTKQRQFRSRLEKLRFDAVLCTGDMVSDLGNAEPFYELLDVLHELNPAAPVYFIAGDMDPDPTSMSYAPGGSPFAPWILGARHRHATYLSSPQCIEGSQQRLWFLSLTSTTLDATQLLPLYEQRLLAARSSADENAIELAEFQLKSIQDAAAMRNSLREEDVTIVLTHVPNTNIRRISSILFPRTYPIHVLLYGHTLGGLMRLPGIGPLFVPSDTLPRFGLFPASSLVEHPKRMDRTWIIPSSGLGDKDPMYPFFFFRLFNPPSVNLLTLSTSSI